MCPHETDPFTPIFDPTSKIIEGKAVSIVHFFLKTKYQFLEVYQNTLEIWKLDDLSKVACNFQFSKCELVVCSFHVKPQATHTPNLNYTAVSLVKTKFILVRSVLVVSPSTSRNW